MKMNKLLTILLISVMAFFTTGSEALRVRPIGMCLQPSSATECGICEYVATIAETFLSSNRSVSEVEAILEKGCGLLPDGSRDICDSLVVAYFPRIVEMLEADYPPSTICTDLGICSSTYFSNNATCDRCLSVSAFIESTLTSLVQGDKWNEIAVKIEEECTRLPTSEATLCQTLVGAVPAVVEKMIASFPPQRLCSLVHMC